MTPFARSTYNLRDKVSVWALFILCASTTLIGCNSAKEPVATASQMEEVQAAVKRIEGDLASIRLTVPRETEERLKELESKLNDRTRWPKDAETAEKWRRELDETILGLPPIVAERILPQLTRLNWGVESLWNLRAHANSAPEQLEDAQEAIEEILERRPRGQFQEIQKELDARLKEIASPLRRHKVQQLLQRANRALDGKEDASEAYSSLGEFRGEKEVNEIMLKLRTKVLEKTGLERIDTFQQNLTKTRSFADDRARQVSLITIQEGVLRLLVDLELEEAAPRDVIKKARDLVLQCEKELLAFASRQTEENAKKMRRYQAWALEQIRKFDGPKGWYYDLTLPWVEGHLKKFREATEDEEWVAFEVFPSMKELVQELVGVDLSEMKGAMLTAEKRKEIYKESWRTVGWKNNLPTELAYRATRDGMVKFLLPIQPNLLDPPVAQLFQQAFAKGWQKLEGRDDQLFVAQQAAIVPKKTVEEIVSSNP